MHILEAENIIFETRHLRVLDNVYVRVETGSVTGILGRNGSGKSCLMKVAAGILGYECASVRVNGLAVVTPYLKKGLVNYLPQEHFVPKRLKVAEAFRMYGVPMEVVSQKLKEIKLNSKEPIGNLSSGEIRLIETLMVLLSPTKFSFLDEPFSYLMPLHIEFLTAMINQEKQKKGILISDHMYRDIVALSDRLYMVSNGKLYTVSNVEDLADYGYIR